MSKSKYINFANANLFGAALLAVAATEGLNPTRIQAVSNLSAGEHLPRSERMATGDRYLTSSVPDRAATGSGSAVKLATANLLAQTTNTSADNESSDRSKSGLLKRISLGFLLLFFVPLGIFYPLFLFYKMLLVKPQNSANSLLEEQSEGKTADLNIYSPPTTNITKATVSKLQIAFSPPARELRKELCRVSSIADLKQEDNIVELMHQTIDVLIEQGHWTHISQTSNTFPLNRVRPEFDEISERERHKFSEEQSGLVNYNRNVSGSDGYERNYSYVVVTLILCTSHTQPLFQTVTTKEQLIEELTQLKKISENAVIKFELLWNPQQEDVYISNDQLLVEYDEMTRLL